METVTYACHTAYLDPMTGSGLMTRPNPEDDLRTGGLSESLREADWNNAMRDLNARGWEPSMDEEGDRILVDSHLPDGSEVIALYGRNPIIGDPSFEEMGEAFEELRRMAGAVA